MILQSIIMVLVELRRSINQKSFKKDRLITVVQNDAQKGRLCITDQKGERLDP